MNVEAQHLFVTAPDGLKLHVCCHGCRTERTRTVVCLPGLSRSTEDFDALAQALASDPEHPRRVFSVDYRGRGQSEYDRDPGNYSLTVELADLVAALTALEIHSAVFVGTSRGGILAMMLAAVRPVAMDGVVLNDIGPVIDIKGLVRIKSYVGRMPQPKSFDDGAEILRQLFGTQFPTLTVADWQAFARRSFAEQSGMLVPRYDPKLARVFKGMDFERALPPLWKEFAALAAIPLMVVRGANSDVLSAGTVEAMRLRHPDMETFEVPDEGHAPLLMEGEVVSRIAAFVDRCGRGGK